MGIEKRDRKCVTAQVPHREWAILSTCKYYVTLCWMVHHTAGSNLQQNHRFYTLDSHLEGSRFKPQSDLMHTFLYIDKAFSSAKVQTFRIWDFTMDQTLHYTAGRLCWPLFYHMPHEHCNLINEFLHLTRPYTEAFATSSHTQIQTYKESRKLWTIFISKVLLAALNVKLPSFGPN
jgi:hypothetical protein